MKMYYNQTLQKACELDYESGPISSEYKIIHTRAWDLHNLFDNLKHRAVVCMAMGDCGLEQDADGYKLGRWFEEPIFRFKDLPENILRLYTIHAAVKHNRIEGTPCGLMYSEGSNVPVLEEVEKLNIPKTKLLYLKFHPNSHPSRPYLLNYYGGKSWATVEQMEPAPIYFRKMAQHKFVLCPRGHGPDCYRTWEALHLGCIPIVQDGVDKGGCHDYFINRLPILPVSDLSRLTKEVLETIWADWSKREWNWELLEEEYWIKKVKDESLRLLSS